MNLKSIFKINLNIAGVDEVGRGSLIGPVYASAVILKKECDIKKLKDSKQLTKKKREILNKYIKKNSYWSIASASKKEIEKLNILNATLLAMQRAIKKLKKKPKIVLIDGNRIPKMKNYNLKYVIKGDQKVPQISAASIIAKVSRDNLMKKISKNFMKYQWIRNCGYGTRDHLSAIKKFGITKHHRKTFKPIHNILSPK
jgi:ribonuclease HII